MCEVIFDMGQCFILFRTGGWLNRSTVHIGLFNFGRGSFKEHFLRRYLGHRFRELFEYIMVICNQLSNLVEMYHEGHFREFRVCIETA